MAGVRPETCPKQPALSKQERGTREVDMSGKDASRV
jgi:hypothetical protein